jgi:hypothetical protein
MASGIDWTSLPAVKIGSDPPIPAMGDWLLSVTVWPTARLS